MKYKPASELDDNKIIREDYSKSIIFNVDELPEGGHLIQSVTIPPNTKQRNHSHNKQTEIFYILEGECSIFFNENEIVARPGDTFVCETGDEHYLWNKSDQEFKLLVFKTDKPADDDDTNWLE